MKRTSFIFLFLLLNLLATAQIPGMTQQRVVDSLFTLLPEAKGKVRVDLLNQLTVELAPRNFDSAFRYASEARRFAEVLNYPKGIGVAIFNLGNCYFFKADVKSALLNYHTALRMLEPFGPSKELGNLLIQLGAVNQYVCNTKKVTAYFKRAAGNFIAIGDSVAAMIAYMTLANSYYYIFQILKSTDSLAAEASLARMDSAVYYNKIVLDYYLIPRREYAWMPVEAWLVNIYNAHGNFHGAKGDSLSVYYSLKALEQATMLKDTNQRNFLEGLMCSNLGSQYYFELNTPDKGYEYAKLAIEILKKTLRPDIYAMALFNLGAIEMDKGHFQSAGKCYFKALDAADSFLLKVDYLREPDPTFRLWGVTQMRYSRILIFTDIVKLNELEGDFKNALLYQKKVEEEKSIQSRDELTRQVIGLEAEYEDELKRQEIDGLRRDNELRRLRMNQTRILFAGLGSALLIVFLASVVWIQRKRFRSEQRSLVLEQKLLRSQMNPHFIFNSLTNIQNFILTEKPDKASIYLSKFAGLVRSILDNSVEEYVVLEKEIDTLENYLELQKIRFAGKFDYRIHVADEIDTEALKIPPMLAQPFIENAIEHGIRHRETPGHIEIRFSLKDRILVFEVEDDGIGRQKAREIAILQDPQHRSMATSLTRERLANLNRKMKEKIRLEITDLTNALGEATGTRVRFGIPV